MTAIVLLTNKDLIAFAQAHVENDLEPTTEMFALLASRLKVADLTIEGLRDDVAQLKIKAGHLGRLLNEIEAMRNV